MKPAMRTAKALAAPTSWSVQSGLWPSNTVLRSPSITGTRGFNAEYRSKPDLDYTMVSAPYATGDTKSPI